MNVNFSQKISIFLDWWLKTPIEGVEGAVFERYYRNYIKSFGPRMQFFYESQSNELMNIVRSFTKQPDVLEIGSGTGTESLWMALNGANVIGIDITEERLQLANKRKKILESKFGIDLNVNFLKKNVLEMSEMRFDVVWMEQAFHHLEPREQVLQKISTLVKSGGYVVISESNAMNPLNQLQLFMRRGFKTIKKFIDADGVEHVYGDERILTANKLKSHLRAHGFEILSIRYYRIFPSGNIFEKLISLEKAWPKILFFAFTHFNIVAKKI